MNYIDCRLTSSWSGPIDCCLPSLSLQSLPSTARSTRCSKISQGRLKEIHKSSTNHRQAVLKSKLVGCFYCQRIFEPSSINHWIDKKSNAGQTATCPYCSIDAILPQSTRYHLSSSLLEAMNKYWF